MTIPTFTSTEEAIAFGLKATEEEKVKLYDKRMFEFNIAMLHATQSQFCREALEAKEKVQ